MSLTAFHLAIPVINLEQAEIFYGGLLGCQKGRSCAQWIDWNFFGHQLVTHLVSEMPSLPKHNQVDNHAVPVPHFGMVLIWQDWQQLAKNLEAKGINFVIKPHIRFEGQVGEQATMFFLDPSGNALEFKAFQDIHQLFAS
ncbi:VOC family protein [Paraglaciecola arctica]|uniref:Probable dioxygenase n=1 Tax=Paraglaciecola arctica BSs20135 TaxID=493475 RepID=K6YM14_9ALTE|nr:VOC family protein [Paraglaciecola arctica]GAC19207.1 probable dioxygenase [Paraglaciecola arctica BSs20135]